MKKNILVSIAGAVLLVGGALFVAAQNKSSTEEVPEITSAEKRVVTRAELSAGTGVDGNPCYTAVDGVVYEIRDSILWVMGLHTPTKGKIKCGDDHSESILNSPHGKSKLKYLDVVGTLEP